MFTNSVTIIQYKIGVWGAEKTERSISDNVCEQAHADKKAGKFIKSLLGGKCEELKAIQNFAQLARITIRNMSLPYNTGAVMVPNVKLVEILEKLSKINSDFNSLVQDFLDAYPTIVERARERSADLFKEGQCPSINEVANKFNFQYHLEPMPDSNSFDKTLGLDNIRDQIKHDLEKQIDRVFLHAENELESRLLERSKTLLERLTADSSRQISNKVFKKTKEVAQDVLSLNVRGNQKINDIATTLLGIASNNSEYYANPLNKPQAISELRQILGIWESSCPVETSSENSELEQALARL